MEHGGVSQREAFLSAVRAWAEETGADGRAFLLFALDCVGHPQGMEPADLETAMHPTELLRIDALTEEIDILVDGIGVGEDFLVTALVRAIDEHLARRLSERRAALEAFRGLQAEIQAVRGDPQRAAAFRRERGLQDPDLGALLEQVRQQITVLESPEEQQRDEAELAAWRRATAPLLEVERRLAWEAERFRAAGDAMARFIQGQP